ncbi:PLP-dependent aminotransferase family protein [Corynebacterium imitans]|uniref:aminotransferase-like domain-containing protein n=1 Tax=Corynebacterium imitans TaxID=156978 RepID=UPI00254EB097|nr:PLP-dependent aminotransferase family protein [Corynebacterium imitans]MDK8307376.1 PLP-dependent aminotransferase family protein [Corynebacterium imitans]MDK8638508.1 PLP-dependent aminotransferase family protein [Corynebacterium imitans]MDK8773750.1 PLP-dependent aminotransferase family protein [Corynebacterium imitans]
MSTRSTWHPWIEDGGTAALHERLAGALESDILRGEIAPGARLPAHRDLARRLGISVGTVTRAYMNLERRGLVTGEHGRGTFVAAPDCPRDGTELIDLSVNVPPPMLAARKLASTLTALPQLVSTTDLSTYSDPLGILRHRQAIATWLSTQGMPVTAERVLITHGAQHALAVAFAAAGEPRGVVITEAHTYPGALESVRQTGKQLISVRTDDHGVIPDVLADVLRSTQDAPSRIVYLTPTLHNPFGYVMDQRRRTSIVDVCRKYDATIIEDDVYSVFRAAQTTPLATLAPERTWYVNGFSKSLSPGLRVGTLVSPENNQLQGRAVLQATTLGVSPLMAELVARWISDGTAADIAIALRAESEERLDLAGSMLADRIPFLPSGGFHLWLPMPRAQAEETAHLAAREGILVTPPTATLTDPSSEESGLRVCIGRPDPRQLERGLARLKRLIETMP